MKWVSDKTGHFGLRPYYSEQEIDDICETIISDHLRKKWGQVLLPVPTDALTTLIERDALDLELYADLSAEGPEVEGMTEFSKGEKPSVFISRELTTDLRREHRFRTTLAHEYGHVYFHGPLYDRHEKTLEMFAELPTEYRQICKRDTILRAKKADWMEWQAGYCCGALLMPATLTRKAAVEHLQAKDLVGSLEDGSFQAMSLAAKVAALFYVSTDAARIRLIRLGYIGNHGITPGLSI